MTDRLYTPSLRPGLIPGVNVDRVDIDAGLAMAVTLNYDDPEAQMVTQYALQRWQRGEEEGADRTWIGQYPHDLTSWRAILSAAIVNGMQP